MKTTKSSLMLAAVLGVVASAGAADEAPAPPTTNPALAGDGVVVGVARRDGVSMSGGEIFVTRNGATEKLTKDLKLPSGVTARPDGTIVLTNHSAVTLRSTQILTFEGKIVDLPRDPNVNPAPPPPAAAPASTGDATAAVRGTGTPAIADGSHSNTRRSDSAATVFLDGDGVAFMGTLGLNGAVTKVDGTVLAPNASIRPVVFGSDGTPTLGTVGANGTVMRADGASVFPDGSVRAANGTMLSPARTPNATTNGNAARGQAANPANNRPNRNGAQGGQAPLKGGAMKNPNGNATGGTTGNATQGSGGTRANVANGTNATDGGAGGTGGGTGGAGTPPK